MLTFIVWWATVLLELLIFFRTFRNGVLRAYPVFTDYLACVCAKSISVFVVCETKPSAYLYWYWGGEFVCVLAGYGFVLELLEKSLRSYEGPRRFARNTGLVVLALIVGFTALQLTSTRGFSAIRTSVEVERNLRSAELILLAVIVLVIRYYSISVGRNVKGLILGYGLVVAAIVMDNALRSYVGSGFQAIFSWVRSYSYLVALLAGTAALWSHDPNPVPRAATQLPADYELLTRTIRSALNGVRGNLWKAVARD